MTSTDRKASAAIYLRAAEMMAEWPKHARPLFENHTPRFPSCHAVRKACRGNTEAACWYRDVMLGGITDVGVLWGDGNAYTDETYNDRILLLCFAAEVVKRP